MCGREATLEAAMKMTSAGRGATGLNREAIEGAAPSKGTLVDVVVGEGAVEQIARMSKDSGLVPEQVATSDLDDAMAGRQVARLHPVPRYAESDAAWTHWIALTKEERAEIFRRVCSCLNEEVDWALLVARVGAEVEFSLQKFKASERVNRIIQGRTFEKLVDGGIEAQIVGRIGALLDERFDDIEAAVQRALDKRIAAVEAEVEQKVKERVDALLATACKRMAVALGGDK